MNVTEELINNMMDICGYNARYHHLKQMGDYPWYHEYTCTPKEMDDVKIMWYRVIKKHYPYLSKRALDQQWSWFWLKYGLREVGTDIDDK